MRIVYDHTIFARQRHGGISRYFFELASRVAVEHDVVISAPLFCNRYLKTRPELCRGLYLDWGWGTGTVADAIGGMIGPFGLNKPRIFHETFYSLVSPYGTPPGRRVTTVHDMIDERFYPNREIVRKKKASIERADLVLCVSNRTREDLLSIVRLPEDRVKVVRLGYELRETQDASGKRIASFPYLLHVGPRGEYKNFALLLRAFSATKALSRGLGLVCFGGPNVSSEEHEMIRAAGLVDERFRHLRGDDDMLARCYRDATALVMPSLYEGFGIPLLEAMSFGCPVCSSNGGALAEIAGEAALFFDPKDVEACSAALETIVFDASARKALIELGHDRVKHFGWQKCADETCAAYGDA
jgi:glycosyltransferase involved in cell wall biosynthesis